MKPFFSYYGSKYTVARYLGPPRAPVVIEPFAGSAAYSVRWEPRKAILCDINPDIVALWKWLIGAAPDDIAAIPDTFEDFSEIMALPRGAQILVRFWIAKGRERPASRLSPWYFRHRKDADCRVWGAAIKRRLIAQLPKIKGWEIHHASWEEIDVGRFGDDVHWHIDPPYSSAAGRKYPFSSVDYEALANWCRKLPGAVDVCEQAGATWLPFEPLCTVNAGRGRHSGTISNEVVFRRGAGVLPLVAPIEEVA